MKGQAQNRSPELLREIHEAVTTAFLGAGKPQDVAEDDAGLVVDTLTSTFGGEMLYIPSALMDRIDERHKRIREEFTGDNQRQLARKHGYSIQHIYRIIKKMGGRRK